MGRLLLDKENESWKPTTSKIDNTPAAYKDIDAVMAAQTDPVEVMHTRKQLVCVKG
jgi:RNA-splicing ligase RtcB